MDSILRAAPTQTLEELVHALLTAANYGNNWEAQRAAPARQITQQLGLSWEFTDWQDAYDTIGVRALEILRQRRRVRSVRLAAFGGG